MLVGCPNCKQDVEIDPRNGSVFECPYCYNDFEIDLNFAHDVDYSSHFWGLALEVEDNQDCLDYIAQINGELPENRLIEVSSNSSNSTMITFVAFLLGSFFMATPFLVIWGFSHLFQNLFRKHKQYFWVRKWKHYLDPKEKVVITITDFKNGSYPTQVAHLEPNLKITTYNGGSEGEYYHELWMNSKQRLRFEGIQPAEQCLLNIENALQ